MLLARFLLLFTVIVWGWSFVATKVCLQYMTPIELIGLRFIIALPILLSVVAAKKIKLNFRSNLKPIMIGSAIITVHFFIQITGLQFTSATNTGWIIAVTPLVMAFLAWAILKERISRNAVIGIGVATFGIILLVSEGRFADLDWLSSGGDWLVLASAHTWALYTIATRNLSRRENPLAVTVVILLPSSLLVLGYMAFTSDFAKFAAMPADAIVAVLFLGVFAMALAHWFWQESIARVGAAEAGIFLYLEPLSTTALAVPYLGESFGIYTAIGGMIVLGAVWYAQRTPNG